MLSFAQGMANHGKKTFCSLIGTICDMFLQSGEKGESSAELRGEREQNFDAICVFFLAGGYPFFEQTCRHRYDNSSASAASGILESRVLTNDRTVLREVYA